MCDLIINITLVCAKANMINRKETQNLTNPEHIYLAQQSCIIKYCENIVSTKTLKSTSTQLQVLELSNPVLKTLLACDLDLF